MRRAVLVIVLLVASACLLHRPRHRKETIINGRDETIQKYPWFVSFPVTLIPPLCGGSLIHPRVVLTATHCIQSHKMEYLGLPVVIGPKSNIMLDPEIRRLNSVVSFPERAKLLKDPKTIRVLAKYGQVRRIVKIKHLLESEYADLTLLLLDAPSTAAPVRLAPAAPRPGAKLKTVGFGRVNTWANADADPPKFKPLLQSTRMTVFNTLSLVTGKPPDVCPPNLVCATGDNATPCNGDSGSALLTASGELTGVVKGGGVAGCRPVFSKNITYFMSVAHYRGAIERGVAELTRI